MESGKMTRSAASEVCTFVRTFGLTTPVNGLPGSHTYHEKTPGIPQFL